MLYTLFLWIYISFSLNGHIKTKNEYFHKILKNNRDEQQIKYVIFGTFFLLSARKIRKFENKFTNQYDLHSSTVFLSDTTFLLFRISHWVNIKFAVKKLNFSNLLVNLIYCGTYHRYSVVILVFTFHQIKLAISVHICTVLSHNMTHQILVQFDKPFLTYCRSGILWYIRILSTECLI
jgi:hypothetical protein